MLRSRIAHGYRLCTAERPSPADLEALEALHGRELARVPIDPAAADAAALTTVASLLLNLDATLTRE